MALKSGIQWTDATWNPTTGCTKVSPGCKNCYAEALSRRLRIIGLDKYKNGFAYAGHLSDVDMPLKWKKPRKIFVNSMSDLFHEDADPAFIAKCFDVMNRADWHIYQILTKRPHSMVKFSVHFKQYFGREIPPHIWLGTSVESRDYAYRIEELRKVRCAVRFVSFEPLLGPISDSDLSGIDWAIIGGESGKGFRQVQKEWIQDTISLCRYYGVPVFFKQWGGPRPKSGGREIDGIEYNEYPAVYYASHSSKSTNSKSRRSHTAQS